MADKVRVGSWYVYEAATLADAMMPSSQLQSGDIVQVVNKFGCPPANTMGQCYVEKNGLFAGMVSVASLTLTRKPREGKTSYSKFIATTKNDCSYNEENKVAFHKQSTLMLRELAKELGLKSGEYDLRSNKGGIAVSGEITLHSDSLYVQFSQSGYKPDVFMWRTCKGRKDYSGGMNQWMKWDQLKNLSEVAARMNASVERNRAA